MTTVRLLDTQWTKIRDFLRGDPNAYIGKDEEECRLFMEPVIPPHQRAKDDKAERPYDRWV